MILATMVSQKAFAQPAPGGVSPVITEIMYNPPEAGTDTLEFIELYNPSTTATINLAGYYFSSGVEYTFPPGVMLPPEAFVIIAKDSVAFTSTSTIPAFEWVSMSLLNTGEGLALRNAGGTIADTVFYDDALPWPAEADGMGASLSICDPTMDNNDPSNWAASSFNTGIVVNTFTIFADPLALVACPPVGIEEDELNTTTVYPNPTEGAFRMTFDRIEKTGSLRIHNSLGQEVHSQTVAAGSVSVVLDLNLNTGVYFLSLESGTDIEQIKVSVK